jgi:hypothetical protein
MKHLLNGVAVSAVLAIATTVWAQAPSTPPSATAQPATSSGAPPSGAASSTSAPAAPDKITAAPGATARPGVQPKARRHAHHVRRYAHYGYYPYYGYPYGYYRWGSPSDHMARQLNAQQLYGWGWGGGPYRPERDSPN